MLAVITRPMVIATDAGTAKQFVPEKDKATGEDVPQTMSESEFDRLRRAGAAQRFIEVNHAEVEPETSKADEVDAAWAQHTGTDILAVPHSTEVVAGVDVAAPVTPKARKAKG